jgi:hypothetical protein
MKLQKPYELDVDLIKHNEYAEVGQTQAVGQLHCPIGPASIYK